MIIIAIIALGLGGVFLLFGGAEILLGALGMLVYRK